MVSGFGDCLMSSSVRKSIYYLLVSISKFGVLSQKPILRHRYA